MTDTLLSFWKETKARIKERFIEVNLPQIKQNLQKFIDQNQQLFRKSWFESKAQSGARFSAVYEAFAEVREEAEQAGFDEFAIHAPLLQFFNECKIGPMAEFMVAVKIPHAIADYKKEMREAIVRLQKLNQELARLG